VSVRRTTILVTLALAGFAAVYGALVLLDLLARHDVRTTQALRMPAKGALQLDTGSGDVTIEAGSGPPRVEAVTRRGLFGSPAVRVVRGAHGRIAVDAPCRFPSSVLSCSTTLRVVVPPGTAVRATSGSGNVTVRGLRGDLVAGTASGDIELEGVGGGTVRADTGSGSITATAVTGRRLQAKTGSGDIDVSATSAPDDAVMQTGSGDVSLTVPDEVYDVRADTGSGDKQVGVRTDPASPRHLQVRTGSGDLKVGD
jgi:Putative adhesin